MKALKHPATVIALLALFVALGGTTYAATSLPKSSVGTKQLKKSAVTAAKIKNGAVTAGKINTQGLTVPTAIHATSATSATSAVNAANATHATSATSATNATNATHATSATNATNAATAANANALGGVSASSYVQNKGDIFIQLGHSNWAPFDSTDPVHITHYTFAQSLTPSSTGGFFFRIDAGLPDALYGKALAFDGIRICYHTNPGNEIVEVVVERDRQTNDGIGSAVTVAADPTIRTDAACRVYAPPAPIAISSTDQFSVLVSCFWSAANTPLYLGNATVILQPTSTTATTPKPAAQHGER